MSEVRLNIIDSYEAIQGTTHGSVADAVVAALSAEPETIAELDFALQRFIKPIDDHRPFALFKAGTNEEPWDAGLVIVDLSARIVAIQSSYSAPQAQGEIQYHDGTQSTDVSLLYRVPDDWQFTYSIDEYRSVRDSRRAERADARPLDARKVLYGATMIEFLVLQCAASAGALNSSQSGRADDDSDSGCSIDSQSEIRIPQSIHARWLMTPRADLGGRTPREVILEKLEFIDFDLHTRELQWSLLGEGPPPLGRDSHAYRFAGFGTHEYVIYYYLVRHLLTECLSRVARASACLEKPASLNPQSDLVAWLEELKQSWLNEPNDEFDGRIPSEIIECERRRIPMVMSAKQMMIDENCDLCRLMAGETGEDFGPGFWHLDGCNMDYDFEFSTCRTREEWEEEQRKWREFNEEFERTWAAEHPADGEAGLVVPTPKVSFSELDEAFLLAGHERHYWLDRRTGRILSYGDEAARAVKEGELEDLPVWMKDEIKAAREVLSAFGELPGQEDERSQPESSPSSVDANGLATERVGQDADQDDNAYGPDRYVSIERIPSHEVFQFMEDFIDQVRSPRVSEALSRALRGNKPFRRFKDALLEFPKERERWFEYETQRRREYIEAWARDEGIEIDFCEEKE